MAHVARIGDRFYAALSDEFVREHGLKEGDQVQVKPPFAHVAPKLTQAERAAVIQRIRDMAQPLPPDWKFDREWANSRGE